MLYNRTVGRSFTSLNNVRRPANTADQLRVSPGHRENWESRQYEAATGMSEARTERSSGRRHESFRGTQRSFGRTHESSSRTQRSSGRTRQSFGRTQRSSCRTRSSSSRTERSSGRAGEKSKKQGLHKLARCVIVVPKTRVEPTREETGTRLLHRNCAI